VKKASYVIILLASGFTVILALAAFLREGRATAVRAVRIERHELLLTIPATSTGIVESASEVKVKAEVPGKVVGILIHEGDYVRAGQTLVILDQKEAEARVNLARSNLRVARARLAQIEAGVQMLAAQVETRIAETSAMLEKAARNLERARNLSAEGAIAREQLDLARTEQEVAKAGYDAALANRDQLRVKGKEIEAGNAAVEQAETSLQLEEVSLAKTVVTSPIDGVVTRKHVSVGETVGLGGGPFFTVLPELAWVEFLV
jgi:multidrug resistance efflux pump